MVDLHAASHTWVGNANLPRLFDSSDLVLVFSAAEYEDRTPDNSSWCEGDWNGDLDFITSDLVVAFQDSGCDNGLRDAI